MSQGGEPGSPNTLSIFRMILSAIAQQRQSWHPCAVDLAALRTNHPPFSDAGQKNTGRDCQDSFSALFHRGGL